MAGKKLIKYFLFWSCIIIQLPLALLAEATKFAPEAATPTNPTYRLEEDLRALFAVDPDLAIEFAASMEHQKELELPIEFFQRPSPVVVPLQSSGSQSSPNDSEESVQAFIEYVSKVNESIRQWNAARAQEEQLQKRNAEGGLVVYEDQAGSRDVRFRILDGIEGESIRVIQEELNRVYLGEQGEPLPQFSEEQIRQVLEGISEVKTLGKQLVANPPSEREVKGLAKEKPSVILKHFLDKEDVQIPSGPDRKAMNNEELDASFRRELTSINGGLVSRIGLPGVSASIVVVDADFVSAYSTHMLLYLSRQVVRAGHGDGRATIVLTYDRKKPPESRFHAVYYPKPKTWSMARFLSLKRAATPPRTKDDAFFSALYVTTVMSLGYAVTFLKNYDLMKHGVDVGPMPDFHSFKEFSDSLMPFLSANFAPLKSHFLCSALIGFFHPTYRFLIYHAPRGKEWWISLKHFMFISFPAGIMTSYYVKGFEGINPLALAGLFEIGRVAVNSLWTNYARPLIYAVPSQRLNHRLNTKVWKLPLGFKIKQQQIEFEMNYVATFALKFAALMQLKVGSFHAGELAYYSLPFVAFGLSMAYFIRKSHEFDYSEGIKDLWSALFSPLKLATDAPYKFIRRRAETIRPELREKFDDLEARLKDWMEFAKIEAQGLKEQLSPCVQGLRNLVRFRPKSD